MPLDLQITRYGNATPSDGNLFSISDVQINSDEETRQPIQDYFAAGQFLDLSDADKLSAPSFEKYDAGVTIGSVAIIVAGSDSPRTVVYRRALHRRTRRLLAFHALLCNAGHIHLAMTAQGAGFASPVKNSGLVKYGAEVRGVAVKTADPSYVVTNVEDLSMRSDIATSGGTYFQARAALDSYLAIHPEEAANLQIHAATRGGRMSDAPLGRYHFLSLGAPRYRRQRQQSRRRFAAAVAPASACSSRSTCSRAARRSTVQPPPLPVQMFGPGDVDRHRSAARDPHRAARLHRHFRAELSLRNRV